MSYKKFIGSGELSGRKRRFIISGSINFLITNIILQYLIYLNIFSLGLCTLISQIVNLIIGYYLYGKIVFNIKEINQISRKFKYTVFSSSIWLINWLGIKTFTIYTLNNNISAFIMIGPLAIISFLVQKHFIFKQNKIRKWYKL